MYLTIFTGSDAPFTVRLEDYGKPTVTFGRAKENDILLPYHIVSHMHGHFLLDGGDWLIVDDHSTNGLTVNDEPITKRLLSDGLKIYIGSDDHSERVLFICSVTEMDDMYKHFRLEGKSIFTIGRQEDADIRLTHTSVSRLHATLTAEGGGFSLKPENKNEVRFNGRPITEGSHPLQDMDRFMIGDTQFLYRDGEVIYYGYRDGIGLEASHLTKVVTSGKRTKTIVDDVSLQILPGELTAIIGCSGAGKTSLMKCVSGCSDFTSGSVLIHGEDIREGYESLKSLIGYVPQQDIVYDNLSLERMLYYSACMRMPKDSTKEDIDRQIRAVIDMVELNGNEKTLIKKLSGGQKKRASIAVELLSDPGIFFLDEPTSGLDPGTEQKLMLMLKRLTEKNKTVILVTHATLNLNLCDRVVFMAPGGKLAYSGAPESALDFFGTDSIVDVYNIVQSDPARQSKRLAESQTAFPQAGRTAEKKKAGKTKTKISSLRQTAILSRRYCEMLVNDRKKLAIIICMPLILGLVMLAATGNGSLTPFKYSADTQTFSLTLACCSFFLGLFQSFQEISKERVVVEREKMADMKSVAYLMSKVIVIGVMLLIQSLILLGFTWIFAEVRPASGVLIPGLPFLEFFITTYLTAFSASAIGLGISACASTSEQTLYAMPLVLMLQILFSEVICSLKGISLYISYIVSCRWSCLSYCASARINELYARPEVTYDSMAGIEGELETQYINARYDFMEKYSIYSLNNPTMMGWFMLTLISVISLVIALLFLRKRREL